MPEGQSIHGMVEIPIGEEEHQMLRDILELSQQDIINLISLAQLLGMDSQYEMLILDFQLLRFLVHQIVINRISEEMSVLV